ncbi:MAG: serine/threonine-protein phosphatase, partial [Planctomycetes bacterium]|nr:serine/threonine-protein phosphatase [Planctomycetota bacterium]
LPQEVPQLGTYSFAHRYTPAHQVGGDFYDYVPLPENQLGVAIGDVSGKGVPAALLMAKLTGNIRYLAASGLTPGELVKEVNKAMRQSGTDLFVTFLYIVIDSDSHKLTIANAAHCPPYIKSENGSVERIECEPGLPAGVLEGTEYEQTELEITAGDRICLYTDGIIEAMDDGKNPFGDERLAEALRQSGPRIAEIAENIEDSVVSFVGNAEQHDDMTLVCFGQDHIGQ